ncbi:hypothetical protein B0J18DRAFT_77866 [Chaetomium sp. MPI-SDFR-AT-0129]|nr:hypothetical protein B0J18DRAFT_77866 [Chaetomium sp. MPI-SDFR-AT-0129]
MMLQLTLTFTLPALALATALHPLGVPIPTPIPPMLRFQCSQLVLDRLDPLGSPGQIPSPHLHQIVGGNSFNATMDPATHDLPAASTCTSCTFTEDLSNYWTAVMYFRDWRNGTFTRVAQKPNLGLEGNGGVTVYYIPPHDNTTRVAAFKPGFRMLVGDATASSINPGQDPKVCHRCMPEDGDLGNLNCADPDTKTFPTGFCVGGIRSVITFPTCWDGVHLDVPGHRSHVAYPVEGNYDKTPDGGVCPETHPVKIPQVMLETIWDTTPFNDEALWPEDGSQPFVWSTNDKDGYTQHGDYVFGWKDDSLQRAMDARCFGNVCEGVLETQTVEESVTCTIPQTVVEDVDGWLDRLPGQEDMPM